MIIRCTISSPQFKDNRIDHYHTQSGFYDDEKFLFTPENYDNGNHVVHLITERNFIKACKEIIK